MKKLLISLIAMLAWVTISSQVYLDPNTVIYSVGAPAGTDSTWHYEFSNRGPWSCQANYRDFDNTDATLAVYSSSEADSALYDLLWIDWNHDGTNDNPKTLSDSSWTFYGETFPHKDIVFTLTGGSVTAGKWLFLTFKKL